MPVCPLKENSNYCSRHGCDHWGHTRKLALDPGPLGEKHRIEWDKQFGIGYNREVHQHFREIRPCRQLGERLTWEEGKIHDDELVTLGVKCNTCNGQRKEYHCGKHRFTNIAKCFACPDYQELPYQKPKTRHLIYHIYPVTNGHWQWNVEQLCGRLKCFNGKIIVAIAADLDGIVLPGPTGRFCPDSGRHIPGCGTFQDVKDEFAKRWTGDNQIHFLELQNDPKLREVKTLMPMLELIPRDDPYSITLYGHAKGTTRARGHIARQWTESIYEIYLDHFPLAEQQLLEYPVTGAFKKLGPGWSPEQSKSDWHYSGSWFWFRNVELFKRDWQRVDQFWSGIEPYPSQHFYAKESGCMFWEKRVPDMNLYNSGYWRNQIHPALAEFRKTNEKYRTTLWPK